MAWGDRRLYLLARLNVANPSERWRVTRTHWCSFRGRTSLGEPVHCDGVSNLTRFAGSIVVMPRLSRAGLHWTCANVFPKKYGRFVSKVISSRSIFCDALTGPALTVIAAGVPIPLARQAKLLDTFIFLLPSLFDEGYNADNRQLQRSRRRLNRVMTCFRCDVALKKPGECACVRV